MLETALLVAISVQELRMLIAHLLASMRAFIGIGRSGGAIAKPK
jgi:hypothetical protein